MTSTDVTTFFDRYASALGGSDLDALADAYAYPSLAVTRSGRQAIGAPDETRSFFRANGERYRAQGITGVRIVDVRATYDEDGLWIGFADLENLDPDGQVVGVEHNAYQLVRDEAGAWTIAVTTPLDAP